MRFFLIAYAHVYFAFASVANADVVLNEMRVEPILVADHCYPVRVELSGTANVRDVDLDGISFRYSSMMVSTVMLIEPRIVDLTGFYDLQRATLLSRCPIWTIRFQHTGACSRP